VYIYIYIYTYVYTHTDIHLPYKYISITLITQEFFINILLKTKNEFSILTSISTLFHNWTPTTEIHLLIFFFSLLYSKLTTIFDRLFFKANRFDVVVSWTCLSRSFTQSI